MMLIIPDLGKKSFIIYNSLVPFLPVEQFGHDKSHVGAGVDEKRLRVTGVLGLSGQEAHQDPKNYS